MTYDEIRKTHLPKRIKLLFIAESPPPPADVQSSRQFYYSDRIRRDDRLFTNTVRALYSEAVDTPEKELEENKTQWLKRLQADGFYMIEALEDSQEHEVTKKDRQAKIQAALPRLLERVKEIVEPGTPIVLIKSNVFDVAAQPLRDAGYNVLNTELVDYPGRFNQKAYRAKLADLMLKIKSDQ